MLRSVRDPVTLSPWRDDPGPMPVCVCCSTPPFPLPATALLCAIVAGQDAEMALSAVAQRGQTAH